MEQGGRLDRVGGQIVEMLAPDPGVPERETERPPGRRPTDLVFPPSDDDGQTRVFVYDEWSYLDGRYLPAWCHLRETRLHGDDSAFIGDVRRRHAVLASRVRRQFAHVRPEGWVRVHHADDGDELDLDAVIEAVVDRRTGQVPDDRLHIRRERAARDVATAFLVDLSASTSSPVVDEDAPEPTEQEVLEYRFGGIDPYDMPPPPEPSRRVLDVAKESVALMCDALDVLGDRHAVYGFSGESRHGVEFHVAKEFDDRTSPATWASIAAMRSLRYTRMGPAVRHATAKLAAQPSRTKLLIVISDGYPQDIDYGPVRGDNEYGLQDTARALRDAVEAGVHPYCVTIDPAGYDYLRRMCPDQSYVVIDDVPALPRELAKLYGALATHRD
jgi:nitric oxide reductase activation protein